MREKELTWGKSCEEIIMMMRQGVYPAWEFREDLLCEVMADQAMKEQVIGVSAGGEDEKGGERRRGDVLAGRQRT